MKSKKNHKKNKIIDIFSLENEEFNKENLIEGIIFRPAILLTSFISFIISMFLLMLGNFKWGGSLILFSFVLTIFSLYQSFSDKPSIFRTLNLIFKFVLFIAEIILFNYVLAMI